MSSESLPTLPTARPLPDLPNLPSLPTLPSLPDLSSLPSLSLASLQSLPFSEASSQAATHLKRLFSEFQEDAWKKKRELLEAVSLLLNNVDIVNNVVSEIDKHGEKVSISKFLTGVALVSMWQNEDRIKYRKRDRVKNLNFMLEAYRHMRYATAAYGALYVAYARKQPIKIDAAINQPFVDALREHCNIPKEHLIESFERDESFTLSHFLAYDPQAHTLVLSIRGTQEIGDIFTDVVANYAPLFDGYAHSGFLKAGEILFLKYNTVLAEVAKKYPGCRVSIVGHSAGAAAATILSLMFKRSHPNFVFSCFAFASPPVLSEDLAEELQGTVLSFVNGRDIVTRLCLGSVIDLKKLATMALTTVDNSYLNAFGSLLNGRKGSLSEFVKYEAARHEDEFLLPGPLTKRLTLAGDVIHFADHEACEVVGKKNQRESMDVFRSHSKHFHTILLTSKALKEHDFAAYEESFRFCINKIKAETVLHPNHDHEQLPWYWKLSASVSSFVLYVRNKVTQNPMTVGALILLYIIAHPVAIEGLQAETEAVL
eukprot:TRINITY_DN2561_c1_g1_i2.p1 TRINITY_DN2561_c1_g1~~TRINITY_DN2561_c1_g1_i2.p1  ORF type:complete len:591 (+),score=125.49 TRINITY_DN2561_c1_g1_i2:152-1774(+)